ncbi:MAG TPA: glutaredoxin 3 [Alphaproteobacteria bacterium]|jgi:glutaredoxin 3
MPKIEIYASMWCGYCRRAKALLDAKGVSYVEHDVDSDPRGRGAMVARGGGGTVPQIFVDGRPIGGWDELVALERQGKLDAVLGLAGGTAAHGAG